MKNFEIRIFVIQLVASILLYLGIQQFYVLVEPDLIEFIQTIGKDNFSYYVQKSDEFRISNKLQHLFHVKMILSFVGLALGYVICSIINFKRGLDWKMALFSVIVCLVIYQFKIVNLPIHLIDSKKIEIVFFVPASISIILSFILYFFSYRIKP